MIIINDVVYLLKNTFKNCTWEVDEFKPNELIFVYSDFFQDINYELCIEVTKKWIGVAKLDKRLEIDFSSNDEIFYSSSSLINYLNNIKPR